MVDYFCFAFYKEKPKDNTETRSIKLRRYKQLSKTLHWLMNSVLRACEKAMYEDDYVNRENDGTFRKYMIKVIEYALKCQKCILYNIATREFITPNGTPISIEGKVVHFFSYINLVNIFFNAINEKGGIPIISKEDYTKTWEWYKYFAVDRLIKEITLGELLTDAGSYLEKFGEEGRMFIKTVIKDFSEVCTYQNNSFYTSKNEDIASFIKSNRKLLISKPITLSVDKHEPREWRGFVMQGELQNVSRRNDEYYLYTPNYVKKYIQEQVAIANKVLPNSYVIDVMEYMDNGKPALTVAEFNPIISSEIFCSNTKFPILKKSRF